MKNNDTSLSIKTFVLQANPSFSTSGEGNKNRLDRKGKALSAFPFLLLLLLSLWGCNTAAPGPSIPYVLVYEELNLNDINYQNLRQVNGFIYLNDAGFRGILVLSDGNGNYKAFDRACPYHPQEACALVSMHSSGFYIEDDCCGSTFDTDYGAPTGGPAQQPLRQYSTFVDGNYLIISSE